MMTEEYLILVLTTQCSFQIKIFFFSWSPRAISLYLLQACMFQPQSYFLPNELNQYTENENFLVSSLLSCTLMQIAKILETT